MAKSKQKHYAYKEYILHDINKKKKKWISNNAKEDLLNAVDNAVDCLINISSDLVSLRKATKITIDDIKFAKKICFKS